MTAAESQWELTGLAIIVSSETEHSPATSEYDTKIQQQA